MKRCNKCGQEKALADFPWKNKAKGIRGGYCKECQKEYGKNHYKSNQGYYSDKSARNNKRYRAESKSIILDHLKRNPCVDCGNSDIRVLQFDHREQVNGRGSRVGHFSGTPSRLKEEIKKCDVRCANCHMIRTFEQMGWTHRSI